MSVRAPDGIKGSRTPAWDCPACGTVLGVVYMRGIERYACFDCDRTWVVDLFAEVAKPRPDVCPCCGGLTMGCDCCDPPTCRCECGWDVKKVGT